MSTNAALLYCPIFRRAQPASAATSRCSLVRTPHPVPAFENRTRRDSIVDAQAAPWRIYDRISII